MALLGSSRSRTVRSSYVTAYWCDDDGKIDFDKSDWNLLFYCFNMYIILFIENLETMRQKFVHGNFYTYKCSSQYCKRNMDKK